MLSLLHKRTNLTMFDAFTDYPIDNLFTDDEVTPVRKCKLITYDRNKYCDVLVFYTDSDGDERAVVSNIKSGYCYKNEARYENGETFTYDELITLPWS